MVNGEGSEGRKSIGRGEGARGESEGSDVASESERRTEVSNCFGRHRTPL